MIEERDLPLLLLIDQKLIECRNESILLSYGHFKEHFNNKSHFNNIARILIEYGLAKEPRGMISNDVAVSKTDKTGYIRIQDIFNENKKAISLKAIEYENTRLTNESLKYEQTIRIQDQKIRNLTEENLSFEKKERWVRFVYFILGNVFMFIGTNFKDISIYVSNLALLNNQQESVKSEKPKNQTKSIQLSKQNDSIMK